ncbi:NAD-specific glutamate dehydrogenase [compost metagenome]
MSQHRLGVRFQRAQHQGGQLFRPEVLAAQCERLVAAHMPLEQRGRTLGMRLKTFARRLAHQHAAVLIQTDARRRQVATQGIRHEPRFAILPHRNQAVRRAKVDTDNHARGSVLIRDCGLVRAPRNTTSMYGLRMKTGEM